jgi:N-acetylglucosaminyldiphosphoundecaprenol N-acetyl-beta-D-mannosaminyltransferase
MGALQIEWLYRLIQEPSRWRRMLALPEFAWAVLRQR